MAGIFQFTKLLKEGFCTDSDFHYSQYFVFLRNGKWFLDPYDT